MTVARKVARRKPRDLATVAKAPRKPPSHIESIHGRALIARADLAARQHPDTYGCLRWLYHCPNGGERGKVEASLMKAEGVRAGIWDYLLPQRAILAMTPLVINGGNAREFKHGLYIELKAPELEGTSSGGLSSAQIEFGRHALSQWYCCCVAYGWEQAWESIQDYLAGSYVRHQWTPPT